MNDEERQEQRKDEFTKDQQSLDREISTVINLFLA